MSALRLARRPGSDGGSLSLAQFELLRHLVDRGDATVGELAAAAGVAQPSATRMVTSLEHARLVRRTSSAADRRHVRVRLTEDGRRAAIGKQAQIEHARDEIFGAFSPIEREHVASFLAAMTVIIGRL